MIRQLAQEYLVPAHSKPSTKHRVIGTFMAKPAQSMRLSLSFPSLPSLLPSGAFSDRRMADAKEYHNKYDRA
jgi:hypothetical protein